MESILFDPVVYVCKRPSEKGFLVSGVPSKRNPDVPSRPYFPNSLIIEIFLDSERRAFPYSPLIRTLPGARPIPIFSATSSIYCRSGVLLPLSLPPTEKSVVCFFLFVSSCKITAQWFCILELRSPIKNSQQQMILALLFLLPFRSRPWVVFVT